MNSSLHSSSASNSIRSSSSASSSEMSLSNVSPADTKALAHFFGKKHKSARENAACLLACTINFLKAADSKASSRQKLEKYLQRCKVIISGNEQQSINMIADCEYLHVALHNLILNAHLLRFEMKKDVFTILSIVLKSSPIGSLSYFSAHAKAITSYLVSHFEEPDMSFFAGNTLRILLRNPFLEQILDLPFLEAIIKISKNTVFEIASESLETFHVIFKQKRQEQKEILSKFLINHSEQVLNLFLRLAETDNYLLKRDILLTLNSILSDPCNSQFNKNFVNDKDHLKQMMNILSSEEQGGFKEVALMLFNHFLSGFTHIENEKVRLIIERNKALLLQCIREGVTDEAKNAQDETAQTRNLMIHILEGL